MSADNWTVCPKCQDRRDSEHRTLEQQVEDGYGNMPIDDWDLLREELNETPEDSQLYTFREDYGFYAAETGTLRIRYRGRCTVCGLSIEFKHELPLYP